MSEGAAAESAAVVACIPPPPRSRRFAPAEAVLRPLLVAADPPTPPLPLPCLNGGGVWALLLPLPLLKSVLSSSSL